MSRENVEIVERVIEAISRGDFDTVVALSHPEWEGVIPEEYPVAGTWRGRDGVRALAKEWLEAWEEFHGELEEFIDGSDAVVAKVRYWGRGRGSGVEVTDRWFYAYQRTEIARRRFATTLPMSNGAGTELGQSASRLLRSLRW